jgi:hypothetical protein
VDPSWIPSNPRDMAPEMISRGLASPF